MGTGFRAWTGGGTVGNVFSLWKVALERFSPLAENDARVMFKVRIWGATDPESLLLPFLEGSLEAEDLPRSLRHEETPLLLENFLKLDVDGNFVERCLNDLWTRGMQPTMMPIDISANLATFSVQKD